MLGGEFFCGGEVVLFAADFAVVFGAGLEEFVAAVGGELADVFAGGVEGGGVERFEANGDF